jgi:hypothetical protein
MALAGGCLVTSSVEFEEEVNVPPAVLDTTDFQLGTIYEFDRLVARELRLDVTVRDENVSQDLELRARVSVDSSAAGRTAICPGQRIAPSGEPRRAATTLTLTESSIQRGACNQVEIFVSSQFFRECKDETFDLTADEDDLASGVFWVWDLTGDPHTNPNRAQELLNSCQTKPPMPNTTPPATMMVPTP